MDANQQYYTISCEARRRLNMPWQENGVMWQASDLDRALTVLHTTTENPTR